jgi:ligand-binding sensor protein
MTTEFWMMLLAAATATTTATASTAAAVHGMVYPRVWRQHCSTHNSHWSSKDCRRNKGVKEAVIATTKSDYFIYYYVNRGLADVSCWTYHQGAEGGVLMEGQIHSSALRC